VLIGSGGNDLFTFAPDSAGSATIVGGNGNDLVDESSAQHEGVAIVPPTPPNTITVKVGADTTAPSFQSASTFSVSEGDLLHFTATATDEPGDRVTYRLDRVPNAAQPYP